MVVFQTDGSNGSETKPRYQSDLKLQGGRESDDSLGWRRSAVGVHDRATDDRPTRLLDRSQLPHVSVTPHEPSRIERQGTTDLASRPKPLTERTHAHEARDMDDLSRGGQRNTARNDWLESKSLPRAPALKFGEQVRSVTLVF